MAERFRWIDNPGHHAYDAHVTLSARTAPRSPSGHGDGHPAPRSLWRLLSLILLAALIGSWPLAYACGPDQTWRPGLYSESDGDDVVASLADSEAVVDSSATGTEPLLAIVGLVTGPFASAPAPFSLGPLHLRSPPGA